MRDVNDQSKWYSIFLILDSPEHMWKNLYQIENKINEYVTCYPVCRFNTRYYKHRGNFRLLSSTTGQQVIGGVERYGVMFDGTIQSVGTS